jgi:dihydroxyacetone kinase
MTESKITSKYFTNSKDEIIKDSLTGGLLSNPNLIYYPQYNFIYDKSQLNSNNVRLVCGGGSGHEPSHSGYVSKGMLTCAVCGDIFSSPSCKNIINAIEKIYSDNGVIVIVKNYSGDVINFSLACEIFKNNNKKVDMIIVDDDISLVNLNNEIEENSFNRRRGLCGTVLLYKILGDLAVQGYSFEEILNYGKNIVKSLYTVGVSLTTCIPPFTHINSNELMKNDEFELGLGIHGEKGKERLKYNNVNDVIKIIFEKCFNSNIKKESFDKMKDVVFVVNNLGCLTLIEMNIIIKSLFDYVYNLKDKQYNVHRIIYGNIMTSLDMRAFSITIMNLNENDFTDLNKNKILYSIDSKVHRTCIWNIIKNPNEQYNKVLKNQILFDKNPEIKEQNLNNKTYLLIKNLFTFLQSKQEELNTLDKKVGDGDIGTGMYNAIGKSLENLKYYDFENDFKNSIKNIGEDIGAGFGGTSGPLYMSFLIRASDFLENKFENNKIENYLNSLFNGSEMISRVGKAKVGDRTMLDYLIPMSKLLLNCKSFDEVKKVFNENRNKLLEDVKKLQSKRGRSSYLDGQEVGFDEPGCVLCDLWMNFIIEELSK